MALNPHLSNAGANAAADATCALLNTGYLRVYSDGTPGQPATADTAITDQVLLAELRFASSAFGSASAGVATAAAITSDTAANATGTATWFRTLKSDGTSVVFDGSIAATGGTADLILNSTAIQVNAQVDVTALTYTQAKS